MRGLERSPGAIIALVLLIPLGLAGVLVAVNGLVALRGAGPDLGSLAVLGLSLLSPLWLGTAAIVALTSPGLSIRSFAVLPITPGRLALGLFAGSLTQLPSIGLAVVSAAAVVTWSGATGPGLLAALAMPLGFLTTLLLTSAVLQLLEGLFTSARGRTVGAALAALIPVLPMALNLGLFGRSTVTTLEALRPGAAIAGWTPFGWAWSAPWELADGRPVLAVVKLLLAAGFLAGLWVVYVRAVEHAVRTAPSSSARQIRGHTFDGGGSTWLTGPVMAIARRRAVTWRRDDRMLGVFLQFLALPAFFLAQSIFLEQRFATGFALYLLAAMPGMTLANDLSVDGPAFSLHVSTGVRGWQDRLGRVVTQVVVFGPLVLVVVVGLVLAGLLTDAWRWLALVLAAFPFSLGLGALVGSYSIGRAPPPRGRPFASPPGGGMQGFIEGLIMLIVPIVGVLPVLGLAALSGRRLPDTPLVHTAVVLAGLLYGSAFLAFGILRGGRVLDAAGPELLAKLRIRV